jgi:ECF sigma factor
MHGMLYCGWTNVAGQARLPVMAAATEITRLLTAWSAGDRQALDELAPIMYEEMRRLAERYMRKEAPSLFLPTNLLIR